MNPLRVPFAVGAFVVRQVGGVGAQLLRAVVDRGHPGHDRSRPDDRLSAMPMTPATPPSEPGSTAQRPPAEFGTATSKPPPVAPPEPPAPPPAPPAPPAPPPPSAPPAPAPPQPPAALVAEVGDPAEPGPEVHVEGEPWPGYGALRAPEIIARLQESDASTRAVVRLYEQFHKQRKTILDATER